MANVLYSRDLGEMLNSNDGINDPALQRVLQRMGVTFYFPDTTVDNSNVLQPWQLEANRQVAERYKGTELRVSSGAANEQISQLFKGDQKLYEETQADDGPHPGLFGNLVQAFIAAGFAAAGADIAGLINLGGSVAGAAGAPAVGEAALAGASGAAETAGAFTLPVSSGGVGEAAGWNALQSAGVASTAAVPASSAMTGAGTVAGGTGLAAPGAAATGGIDYSLASGAVAGAPTVAGAAGTGGVLGTGLTAGQLATGIGAAGQVVGAVQGLNAAADLKSAGASADAFQPYRAGYAKMLSDLMADPSSVTKLPGYEFGLQESNRVLEQNLAKQGLTGSGTAAKALTWNASDYAGKQYQQYVQTLAGLGGANINNVATGIAAQSAGASTEANVINSLAKLIPALIKGN